MRSIFFYTIGIAFMGGIFVRSFFNIDAAGIIFVFFVGGALLVASSIASKSQAILTLSLFLVFLTLGMLRLHVDEIKTSSLSEYEGKEVELVGHVNREPEIRETTMHFYVVPNVGDTEIKEHVLVSTERFEATQKNIQYGDYVHVRGTLKRPESFESDGGRVFDYPGYLKTREVIYMMRYADIELKEKGEPTFLTQIYKTKAAFMESLENILPMPHSGLGEGVLLGVKRALGKDLEETFRETGIIHIVVLSGYNVMIVVTAIMFLLSFMFGPTVRGMVGIGFILLFVLFVGPSATVLRASVMAGLALLAYMTGRTYMILRALMLAGVVMLLINPHLLVHDPGFQLSFLATLALILLAPYTEGKLKFIPELIGMRKIIAATITTQIFVLPLLLYHTGLFSSVSVLVNALVLPVVPVAMLLTFLTGVLGLFFEPLGVLVGFLAYFSLGYIIFISEFFGSLPFASVVIAHFPAWIMFLAYALMATWLTRVLTKSQAVTPSEQNLFAGWTIEEDNEKLGSAHSASPSSSLPFR